MNFFAAKIFEYQLKLNSRSNKLELPFNFSYYIKFVLLEIQYLDCTNSSLTYLHTNNLKRMIMETKIEKYYKESNEIEDVSGDYVVITMPKATYLELKYTLNDARRNGSKKDRAQRIIEVLDEAYGKGKAKWY